MRNVPADSMAMRLAVAIKRLRARRREVDRSGSTVLPLSQLASVHRLRKEGPATAAALAAREHVSQQAIAQILTSLKRAGFINATPDPTDGRKTLISVTEAARKLIDSMLASRSVCLTRAVESTIDHKEQAALEKAIELLE